MDSLLRSALVSVEELMPPFGQGVPCTTILAPRCRRNLAVRSWQQLRERRPLRVVVQLVEARRVFTVEAGIEGAWVLRVSDQAYILHSAAGSSCNHTRHYTSDPGWSISHDYGCSTTHTGTRLLCPDANPAHLAPDPSPYAHAHSWEVWPLYILAQTWYKASTPFVVAPHSLHAWLQKAPPQGAPGTDLVQG